MGNTTSDVCCSNSSHYIQSAWHLSNYIFVGADAPGGKVDMKYRQLSKTH